MTKRTNTLAWIATLTLAACAASTTQAKFVMTLQQKGANVIGIGDGSIDLTDFGATIGSARNVTELAPNASVLGAGSSDEPGPDVNFFHGAVTTPSNFGPGGMTLGESIGDPVFVSSTTMGVPIHYEFGAPLSNRSFYIGESFASLGVNPGSYVWSWGSGAHADTFTLNVLAIGSPAVPEPSTWAMGLIGFAGLAYAAVRSKRAVRLSAKSLNEG
jgi:PEP-CTERM motif-containing protein